jgi:hypothetical protein
MSLRGVQGGLKWWVAMLAAGDEGRVAMQQEGRSCCSM